MGNTKLTSKIKTISRISAVGVILYLAFTVYRYFPDVKASFADGRNAYENGEEVMNNPAVWKILVAFPCCIAMITALVITIVAGLQLLFGMSRGASPFTEKTSRAIKNMGVGLIVFEITMDTLNYIDSGKISIGMMWLAGLVLYAFSLVFRYGTALQKESDETL